MRRALRHDPETGQLRLLITATWERKHDRWEFLVLGDDDKTPVLNKPHLDGREVFENRGMFRPYYITNGSYRSTFAVRSPAVVDIKVPCKRNGRGLSDRALCLGCEPYPEAGLGLGLTEAQQCALARLADPLRTLDGILWCANGVSLSTAQSLERKGLVEFTAGSTHREWGIRRAP
jgi:hypothetical protein